MILDFEGGVIHPAAGLFPAAQQEGFLENLPDPSSSLLWRMFKGYFYKMNREQQIA
jgi:hypothetical protein